MRRCCSGPGSRGRTRPRPRSRAAGERRVRGLRGAVGSGASSAEGQVSRDVQGSERCHGHDRAKPHPPGPGMHGRAGCLDPRRSLQLSQICKGGFPADGFEAATGAKRDDFDRPRLGTTCLVGCRNDGILLFPRCPARSTGTPESALVILYSFRSLPCGFVECTVSVGRISRRRNPTYADADCECKDTSPDSGRPPESGRCLGDVIPSIRTGRHARSAATPAGISAGPCSSGRSTGTAAPRAAALARHARAASTPPRRYGTPAR